MKKQVFKTYEELFEGFKSGRLDGYKLFIGDELVWFLSYEGNGDEANNYTDDDWEEHRRDMNERVEFIGNGIVDVVKVLRTIGIPTEWCR